MNRKKRDPARHSSKEVLGGILGRRRFLHLLSSGLIGRIGIPGTAAFANPSSIPLFREVAAKVGLKFRHFAGATGEYYMPEIMGAGVALFDYDNDGDSIWCRGRCSTLPSIHGARSFLLRRGGNLGTGSSEIC